jgi:hypothetical protein
MAILSRFFQVYRQSYTRRCDRNADISFARLIRKETVSRAKNNFRMSLLFVRRCDFACSQDSLEPKQPWRVPSTLPPTAARTIRKRPYFTHTFPETNVDAACFSPLKVRYCMA